MKYACEIMADVIAKKKVEEASRLAELKRVNEKMENFQKHIEEIDTYVEKKLIEGNGKAELMIDKQWYCEGFWYFSKKDCSCPEGKPYWRNIRETEDFPLELYIERLREHCFIVEKVERPFTAYSASLNASKKMDGIILKISV